MTRRILNAAILLAWAAVLCAPVVLSAAELTENRDIRTPVTWVPQAENQPIAYGNRIACSQTDPTDLLTCLAELRPEQRVLIDVPPSADTVGKLIYRSGDQSFYETRAVGGSIVPASATFRDYTDAAFDGNFATRAALPTPISSNLGTWAWVYGELQAYRVFRGTAPNTYVWTPVDINRIIGGVDYVGHFDSDAEATPHVTAVGDFYNNDTTNTLRAAVTYTPQSGEPTRYEAERLLDVADIQGEIDRHEGAQEIALLLQASPASIDKNNIPNAFDFDIRTRKNFFDHGHSALRYTINFLGVTESAAYLVDQGSASHTFMVTAAMRRAIALLPATGSIVATLTIQNSVGTVDIASTTVSLKVTEGGSGGEAAIAANTARSTANEARLATIPNYAARLTVSPPNVRQHSDFQRRFQSTLSGLAASLATDAGSTGTRFTNTFRILTQVTNNLGELTTVLLHTQGWSFTADNRQSVSWEVDASEFNSIGADSLTTGIEVWGEFRAVYGGGVDELRGATNPVFIDFGDEAEWPATRGEAQQAVDQAVDIQYAEVATAGALTSRLAAHATSTKPLLIRLTAAMSPTIGGVVRNYPDNQVLFLKPGATTPTLFFVLPGGASSGQSAAQVRAAILAALPPFADIRLLPGALPGSDMPNDFYVELTDKLFTRTIDGLTLTLQGQTFRPHASTPVSSFDTEGQGLVRFDISAQSRLISNGINATDRSLVVDLTFSFTEGDDYRRRITLPVNNPLAPRLVPEVLDTIAFNAALTLDWLSTDMRSVTLTANVTFAFSNVQVGRVLVLEVKQDATGGKSITWPSSVEWAGGTAVGPSSGGSDVDVYTLLALSKTRVLASALLDVQ